MTRDEQMWEAVEQVHSNLSVREAFVTLTALEWADKTMIEKACEWLKENIWVYINYEGCSGEELENDVIEDFRKAMEE